MINIQYQILRFLPDRVSGEFVNLGVVAFDSDSRSMSSKFITRVGKLSNIFPNVNGRYLVKSVRTISDHVSLVASQLISEFAFEKSNTLDRITQLVLPKDDSALVFSEIKRTLDVHVDAAVNDLFFRFVTLDQDEEDDEEVRKDKEVWSKIYKKHFDKYGISNHFHSHKVVTQNDEVVFDKAWKNGAWHCFEPVTFNLSRPDIIKNKVYKWVGKLEELNTSVEPLNIYLLSVLPHDHPELVEFITSKIKSKSTTTTTVQIVSEQIIDSIADNLKKQIESHE